MDARPITVGNILHTTEQYIIPLFQRYYSWEKKHWDQLRKDIWALMEDGDSRAHFLGPLVCTRTPGFPGDVPAYQLIDGQQRLTTLTVLLAAVRDVALARGIRDLPEEVSEEYLLHKRKEGLQRYKVLPRLGDREALIAIVERQDVSPFADSGIVDALRYFRRHADHWARQNAESQLRKLLSTVASRLQLVVVTIDSENPYAIFESLNATGLPLAESDLIRNYLFMQVLLAQQQDFHERHWKTLEDMFEATDTDEAVPMTPFYRDYLMKDGLYSKEKSTFADFKKHQSNAKLTAEQQVAELIRFASLDLMLCRPRTVKRENLRRLLCQVEGMEITTAFPLILNLLERNSSGRLSDDELDGCLLDLVSFVLRRSICGESTRQYGKWFVDAIASIKTTPRADLQQYWLWRRWPDDAAVRDRLVDFPLYWREGKKARVMLEAIEDSFGHKEKVELGDLSIEHIMPQSIGNNAAGRSWKAMLGPDWQEVHDKFQHVLGNLTLTGYNPDLSNSSYKRKKELLAESHLELNRHFDNLTAWTAETIKARSFTLGEIVVRLWPRPVTGTAYSASAEAQRLPEGLSDRESKRLEYWRTLDVRLEERGIPSELITPTSESWLDIPLGKTRSISIQIGFYPQRERIFVSLVLEGDVGKAVEARIVQEKEEIEKEMGYKLEWNQGDIFAADDGSTTFDREDWPVQHDWIGDHLEDYLRVFKPRVEKLEDEVLADPELREKVETRRILSEYWSACAEVFTGSKLHLRQADIDAGRHYCRFDGLEADVGFGVSYTRKHEMTGVYFKVDKSAPRSLRTAFKAAVEEARVEMRNAIGPELEWEEPYLSAYVEAKIEDRSSWPAQHQWLRDRAEKMYAELSKRLNLDA
jgi:hypothetical protein